MLSTYEKDARVFKAFCDGKRLRILDLLCAGEKCACVLIDHLGIGQSALSYHMKILVGLVLYPADKKENGRTTKLVKQAVPMPFSY